MVKTIAVIVDCDSRTTENREIDFKNKMHELPKKSVDIEKIAQVLKSKGLISSISEVE